MASVDTLPVDLAWLRGYVAGRSGLLIAESRTGLFAGRVGGVIRTHRLPGLSELVAAVRDGNLAVYDSVVAAVVTHGDLATRISWTPEAWA